MLLSPRTVNSISVGGSKEKQRENIAARFGQACDGDIVQVVPIGLPVHLDTDNDEYPRHGGVHGLSK